MAIDIRFLGIGGAHDIAYGNSAAIVTIYGQKVLVDCGYMVYPRLAQLGLVEQLDAVLITHLHDDHVGSLSALLYDRYFRPPGRQLQLLYPDDFEDDLLGFLNYAMLDARKFCKATPLSDYKGILPIDTYGRHFPKMTSYAYAFDDGQDCIAYSGDLADAAFFFDVLQHLPNRPRMVFQDVSWYETPVHAHYKAIEQYLPTWNVLGYHHNPATCPSDNQVPLVYTHPELNIEPYIVA